MHAQKHEPDILYSLHPNLQKICTNLQQQLFRHDCTRCALAINQAAEDKPKIPTHTHALAHLHHAKQTKGQDNAPAAPFKSMTTLRQVNVGAHIHRAPALAG